MSPLANITIEFISKVMGRQPRKDRSDRVIETDERVYDHFWGQDAQGDWTVSCKFVGNQTTPFVQLDSQHLSETTFYTLAGYCMVNHIPCLISDETGVFDLDPRYPTVMGG